VPYLKIAGIFFLPFHWYLAKKVESSAQNTTSKPLLSLIALPLFWLHQMSRPRMNFWGLHQFFILNIVTVVFVVPNELALLPLAVNSVFMFAVTLGSPLWKSLRAGNRQPF